MITSIQDCGRVISGEIEEIAIIIFYSVLKKFKSNAPFNPVFLLCALFTADNEVVH